MRVALRAGDLCMCSHTLGTLQQNILHLATEHDIYATALGPNLATAQISPEHFPTPVLSLQDYHFHPDPGNGRSRQKSSIST